MRTTHAARIVTLTLLLSSLTLSGCALGTWEIVMVFGIVVLLFGATRLPALGRALGETIRGFKHGLNKDEEGENKALPPGNDKTLDPPSG